MPKKRTTVLRVCQYCQQQYEGRTFRNYLFCSDACQRAFACARKKDPERIVARRARERARDAQRRQRPEFQEAKKAYNRAYAASHREELRAYAQRPDVRAKLLESKRRSYWQNRDENIARMRERTPETLESRRAYRRERLAHYAALTKQWRDEHPDEWAAINCKTTAKRFGLTEHFTGGQWAALKATAGFRCLRCDRPEPEIKLTVDHIIPHRFGGPNTIDNIQPLCGTCNSQKWSRAIDYRFVLMHH